MPEVGKSNTVVLDYQLLVVDSRGFGVEGTADHNLTIKTQTSQQVEFLHS